MTSFAEKAWGATTKEEIERENMVKILSNSEIYFYNSATRNQS